MLYVVVCELSHMHAPYRFMWWHLLPYLFVVCLTRVSVCARQGRPVLCFFFPYSRLDSNSLFVKGFAPLFAFPNHHTFIKEAIASYGGQPWPPHPRTRATAALPSVPARGPHPRSPGPPRLAGFWKAQPATASCLAP